MMTTHESTSGNVATKVATFVLWAILGLSAISWGLKLWPLMHSTPLSQSAKSAQLSDSQSVGINTSQNASVGSLLGAEAKAQQNAPDAALARLSLIGVLQTGVDQAGLGQGVALISIDAQTPKPYKIGAKVGDSLILTSVGEKSVTFALAGQGKSLTFPNSSNSSNPSSALTPFLRLELPKKMAAATPNAPSNSTQNKDGLLSPTGQAPIDSKANVPTQSTQSTQPTQANIPGLVAGPANIPAAAPPLGAPNTPSVAGGIGRTIPKAP